MSPTLSRSRATACTKLGVALPEIPDVLGDFFLQLLVEGVDHKYVAKPVVVRRDLQ
jgi:hypothetical protein